MIQLLFEVGGFIREYNEFQCYLDEVQDKAQRELEDKEEFYLEDSHIIYDSKPPYMGSRFYNRYFKASHQAVKLADSFLLKFSDPKIWDKAFIEHIHCKLNSLYCSTLDILNLCDEITEFYEYENNEEMILELLKRVSKVKGLGYTVACDSYMPVSKLDSSFVYDSILKFSCHITSDWETLETKLILTEIPDDLKEMLKIPANSIDLCACDGESLETIRNYMSLEPMSIKVFLKIMLAVATCVEIRYFDASTHLTYYPPEASLPFAAIEEWLVRNEIQDEFNDDETCSSEEYESDDYHKE
jgi:hypothetical protein